MAALVKSAALQNVGRCACKEMLRQHSLHQQKAGLSRVAVIDTRYSQCPK
jgi:hypothetical protein